MKTVSKFVLKSWISGCESSGQDCTAFTLVELLVVIATTALLAVMLLPALASPKSNGQAFQCLNNVKQLTLGGIMYANDNNELLIPPGLWINSASQLDWTANPVNTNANLMLSDALIAPYVKTPASFKCPADIYDGPVGPRVRSYSLNGTLGGAPIFGSAYQPDGVPRIYFSARKTADLNTPGPANIFAFLDEHPDSINDGEYMLNAGELTAGSEEWRDFPGNLHDGAVSIAFVDGHSLIHKWADGRTNQKVEFRSFSGGLIGGTTPINSNVNLRTCVDYEWLEDRMPYHY